MEETKSVWLSKTFWMNIIIAITAGISPTVSEWIAANPETVTTIWAALNIGLRWISKNKLSFY